MGEKHIPGGVDSRGSADVMKGLNSKELEVDVTDSLNSRIDAVLTNGILSEEEVRAVREVMQALARRNLPAYESFPDPSRDSVHNVLELLRKASPAGSAALLEELDQKYLISFI